MLWEDLEERLDAAFAASGRNPEPNELSEPFPLARIVEEPLKPEEQEELAPKSIWTVPGAEHTGGIEAQPAEYERRVVGFFNRALLERRTTP